MKKIPFCCPCSEKYSLDASGSGFLCQKTDCKHSNNDYKFLNINGCPVLISEFKTDTICDTTQRSVYVKRLPSRIKKLLNYVQKPSSITVHNCQGFIDEILKLAKSPKVLVIGAGEYGSGTDALWNDQRIEIHGIDIYYSTSVDLICDAHYLPLESNSYDGVWIQAVLEHVVEPNQVVSEIYRVLKNEGVVYAETPFMQQVHEGAYDFARYTVLGHRYLFKNFMALKIGGIGGSAIVLTWSIRYFIWALTRSRSVARLFGLLVGVLLRPLENLLSHRSTFDSSSGVFFLGIKKQDYVISHKELVKLYKGHF